MPSTPVWAWLPGQDQPIRAGELVTEAQPRFIYSPEYLQLEDRLPLDPVELRLTRSRRGIAITGWDGLPGVLRDAKPAGYGADRLNAQAGRDLAPLELLERGVPDGVGAIEVCEGIERKLAWRPKALDQLQALAEGLDEVAPASRALRRLNNDLDTSAGGERPKATVVHDGRQWLAKMQDRGDRPALPAREFVVMRLAKQAGLGPATVDLHTFGAHQVLLVERFDRAGDPAQPMRHLYASGHTLLRLEAASTQGDPRRSYLNMADVLRVWARGSETLPLQLRELWRRMAFNALVGNVDDHAHNHGFVHDGSGRTGWRLAPAFDITPALFSAPQPLADGPVLKLSTGTDNLARANKARLLACAGHFSVDPAEGEQWLSDTAQLVAQNWAGMLREAAGPVIEDAARMEQLITDAREAFAYCEWLAGQL